ncbi:hypothetical protein R3P38DRAFT_2830987 [Favolaschia claudopus]|uniref:Secreted protein n=1 Tax=Favolaschia claudopus TaxID=2862362 RepID=A0AAW0E881_9AGAR
MSWRCTQKIAFAFLTAVHCLCSWSRQQLKSNSQRGKTFRASFASPQPESISARSARTFTNQRFSAHVCAQDIFKLGRLGFFPSFSYVMSK